MPVRGPDPTLTATLDQIVAQAPPDTCLRVAVDGVAVYDHRGSDLQTPASTEKLLTASTALERLGADRTLRTELVAAAPPVDGVVAGDVVLVGGGDPVLTTSLYRTVRSQPADQPTTSVDALVDQLAAAGVREVRGRVLIDDGRYDALRVVPSWPERYLAQDQVGPLGALVIDDGYQLELTEDGLDRVRAADPGLAAGEALAALLASRGIAVTGTEVGRAAPPAGGVVLAAVDSPTVGALVDHVLLRSDNQVAELLLKEVGLEAEGEGSTAAGARAVADWESASGAAAEGAVVVDGSGLDPANATSCQALVAALDAAGPDSTLAAGLPIAGETGTLARRFVGTSAVGRLRAKTGSLNGVRALAGFVELPEGTTATFAFVANGEVGPATLTAEDLLAEVLATWLPPCPEGPSAPIVAPRSLAGLTLAAVPGPGLAVGASGVVGALGAIGAEGSAPVDRCTREAGDPIVVGIG